MSQFVMTPSQAFWKFQASEVLATDKKFQYMRLLKHVAIDAYVDKELKSARQMTVVCNVFGPKVKCISLQE